jgi:hypothetical protein
VLESCSELCNTINLRAQISFLVWRLTPEFYNPASSDNIVLSDRVYPCPVRTDISQKLMMCSENLQNVAQTSSIHLAFLLSCIPQLDSEFPDLSVKALVLSLEFTVFFDNLADSFGTLRGFGFDFSDSDVLLVEQVDQIVVSFGSGLHDDSVLICFCFRFCDAFGKTDGIECD